MGFSPCRDPRKWGRLGKGGAGGKTKAGEIAWPEPPAALFNIPRPDHDALRRVSGRGLGGLLPRAPYASQETCHVRLRHVARLLGARVLRERAYASEHIERSRVSGVASSAKASSFLNCYFQG